MFPSFRSFRSVQINKRRKLSKSTSGNNVKADNFCTLSSWEDLKAEEKGFPPLMFH